MILTEATQLDELLRDCGRLHVALEWLVMLIPIRFADGETELRVLWAN